MRLIDADVKITALLYNEEREETEHVEMTVADYLDSGTEEGCPPTVGGWVSVKDRLPDDTKQKIVFHKRGVSYAYFSGNYWWSSIGGRHSLDTVTYWMPLPEPPKEDEA